MKLILVPTFDEFKNYAFTGYIKVRIKNVPDWKDVNKIGHYLPGIPQGGIGRYPLQDLLTDGRKSVRSFYDARQSTRKLKDFYVLVAS